MAWTTYETSRVYSHIYLPEAFRVFDSMLLIFFDIKLLLKVNWVIWKNLLLECLLRYNLNLKRFIASLLRLLRYFGLLLKTSYV